MDTPPANLIIEDLSSAWTVDYTLDGQHIQPLYQLRCGDQLHNLSDYLGWQIELIWQGAQACRHCAVATQRHFGGGYCYECFTTLARCDLCILSPDRCHLHAGTCREPDWAAQFCMQPHVVYLAATSDVKVGISRAERVWRRWIDQGAHQGLLLARTPSRRTAGMLEAFCAQVTQDRTDWRRLVRGEKTRIVLADLRQQLTRRLADFTALNSAGFTAQPDDAELQQIEWDDAAVQYQLRHPIEQFSPAQKLVCQQDNPVVTDVLRGVLGHFLLCDSGVIDLQAHSTAMVECRLSMVQHAQPQTPQGSLF